MPYAPVPTLEQTSPQGLTPTEPDQVTGVPTTATEVKTKDALTELGGTGTAIIGGFLTNQDYNTDFTGVKRIDIFDEMRMSDATVRAGLSAVKLPILSADWYIKGNREDVREFVERQLFKNSGFTWTAFLRQALTMAENGNAIFEKVFEKLPDGKIGWKRLAPRLSKTIYRWTLNDGKSPGIYQILPTGKTAEIPRWKLLYFINEQEGSNYEGQSLLRAAYSHWYYKKLYYKIDSIATEKQGMGIPKITAPPQATPQDKKMAREVAQNMRTNEKAYFEVPQGFNIEFLDMKANTTKDPKEMIAHHDRQIVKALLAQFLELGANGGGGSYALSEDQSKLFMLSLEYIAKIIQEEMNKAIKELVDLNFAGVDDEDRPTLEYGAIGEVDYKNLSEALQKLVASDLVTPNADIERYLLTSMHLPVAENLDELREENDRMTSLIDPTKPPAEEEEAEDDEELDEEEEELEDDEETSKKADDFMRDLLVFSERLEQVIVDKRNETINP